MVEFNKNNAYTKPEQQPLMLTGVQITQAELSALITEVKHHLNHDNERNNFQEVIHTQTSDTYTHKNLIRQGLKIIHDRITNPEISQSEKAAIAIKLYERAIHCTPGFHNGLNFIIMSFFVPKCIEDLLFLVRYDLVSRTATQLSDEVHANNSVFKRAALYYGVFPLNQHDSHSGDLSTARIDTALSKAFLQYHQLGFVFSELKKQIKGQFSTAGYEGRVPTGIDSETVEKIETILNTPFHAHPCVVALMSATTVLQRIIEKNNQSIETIKIAIICCVRTILQQNLSEQKINILLTSSLLIEPLQEWKQNTIATLNQYQIFVKLQEKYRLILQDNEKRRGKIQQQLLPIKAAYNDQFFIIGSDAQIVDLNWPYLNYQLWKALLKTQMFTFTPQEIDGIEAFIFARNDVELQQHIDKVIQCFPTIEDGMQFINFCVFNNQGLYLQLATALLHQHYTHKEYVKMVAICEDTTLKTEIVTAHHKNFQHSLHNDLDALLQFITSLNTQDLLTYYRKNFALLLQNSLLKNKSDAFLKILSNIQNLPMSIEEITKIRHILVQYSGLTYAARYQAKAVKLILDFFSKEPQITDLVDEPAAFASHTSTDYSLLKQILEWLRVIVTCFQSIYQKTEAWIISLIFFYHRSPKKINTYTLLTDTNQRNENTLMLAAHYQPTAIQPILEALLQAGLAPSDIAHIFKQTNTNGYNALMLAAHYQPTAIQPILEVVLQSGLAPSDIAHILIQASTDGYNALMLAARYQPTAIQSILEALLQAGLAPSDIAHIFKQTNTNGYNALMLAARCQPTAVQPILEAMAGLTLIDIAYILKKTNRLGYNALMLTVHYHPTEIEAILYFIFHSGLPPEDIFPVFWQVSPNKNNVLMLAALHNPACLEPILYSLFNADLPESGLCTIISQIAHSRMEYRYTTHDLASMIFKQLEQTPHFSSAKKLAIGLLSLQALLQNLQDRETDQPVFNNTLKFVHSLTRSDQEKFSKQWYIWRSPILSYCQAELEIENFIHKLQLIISPSDYEEIHADFQNYRNNQERPESEIKKLSQKIKTALHKTSHLNNRQLWASPSSIWYGVSTFFWGNQPKIHDEMIKRELSFQLSTLHPSFDQSLNPVSNTAHSSQDRNNEAFLELHPPFPMYPYVP